MRTSIALFAIGCAVGAGLAAALIRRKVKLVETVVTVEKPVSFVERERAYAARRKTIDPTYRSADDIMDEYWAEEGPFAKWEFDMECEEEWAELQARRALEEKELEHAS